MPPRISKLKRVAFAIAPALMLLAAGELAARCWLFCFADADEYPKYALWNERPGAARFAPHPHLCYALQPNYRRRKTTHNSLGYRGEEITSNKPPGFVRIAVLGGSTTYTEFVADNSKTFTSQLQRLLRTSYGGHVEVINAGCPGYSSWESLINLQLRVLDLEPDLVIVYHGVNDVHARLVRPDQYRSDNTGRRIAWRVPLEIELCRYSCLARVIGYHLGLWHHPGVDTFVRAPTSDPGTHGPSKRIGCAPAEALRRNPPVYFRRNLRNIVAAARANGAVCVLATWAHNPRIGDYAATEHYQRGFKENNDVVRDVAHREGAVLFDFASLMPLDAFLWRDGRHVNEAGALKKAELFAAFLRDRGVIDALQLKGNRRSTTATAAPFPGFASMIRRRDWPSVSDCN